MVEFSLKNLGISVEGRKFECFFQFCHKMFLSPLKLTKLPSSTPFSYRALLMSWLLWGVEKVISPELVLGDVDYNFISRDEEVVNLLKKDPLRWHGGTKVRDSEAKINDGSLLHSTKKTSNHESTYRDFLESRINIRPAQFFQKYLPHFFWLLLINSEVENP